MFFTTIADVLVKRLPSIPPLFGVETNSVRDFYQSKGISGTKFTLSTVTEDFVFKELNQLQEHKSTGLDGISPRFLKDGSEVLKIPITHIVNRSITTSTVPDDFKVARVSPLFKKNSSLEVSNYRPVSVLNTVSKILEKSVYVQFEDYLCTNNLLYQYQSGFREYFSTNTCLVYLTDYIKTEIACGRFVGMVALDVQKAFDCVNHDILCKKLEYMGVDSTWFQSYLSNRSQIVNVNGIMSETCGVSDGVPQGSLLGPLLYLCYCNDMETAITCKLVLYADDSILLVSDKDPKAIEQKLEMELKSTNNWLIENKLTSHPGKCEAILFGSKKKCRQVTDFSVKFNGTSIQAKSSVKYLGTIMDQNLTSQDNISGIIKKANGKLKFLYRQRKHLNTHTRKILSSALTQSHSDYASVFWFHSASASLQRKLQVIQNKTVRSY